MNSLLAGLIVLITYGSWGLWLVKRRWQFEDDLDSVFFWSIIPVALMTWLALYLIRPDFPF
jgi:ABC-type Mn2+/Zn2+ transport system permease subunit